MGKLLEQENTDLGYDAAKGMMSQHGCQFFQTVKSAQMLNVWMFLQF